MKGKMKGWLGEAIQAKVTETMHFEVSKEKKELYRKAVRERIGLRIATLRKMAGLNQEQLSIKAGLQRTHISRIEAGKYAVTFEVVQAIAEALGMTVDIIDKRLADLAPMVSLTD